MKKIVSATVFFSLTLFGEPLKTHTELSYIQTSGNTDTKSMGLDFHGIKSWEPHKWTLDFQAFYAESSGDETKNNWLMELNYYRRFSKRLSFNYLVGYKKDKFSGYEYQFYTGPGIGYDIYSDKKQKLFVDTNLIYSQDKYDIGTRDSYAAGRIGVLYEYRFNENIKFVEDANVRARVDALKTWFLYSKSSIYSKLSGNLSLGVSYKINYQNTPPDDKKSTDTTLMISLVVDW